MGVKRAVRLCCAIAAALVSALAVLVAAAIPPAQAASDRLPDLGMARLDTLQIQKRQDGRRLLRFSSTVVNVGAGSLELHGRRSATSPEMNVTQRIFDDAGGYRDRPTTATMFYAGDGHNHWHVKDLARYTLRRYKTNVVRADAKEGFCFHDNYEFGSTKAAYYTSCGHDPDALKVTMGLSRGWGDIYTWKTVGQYVNVTGLPDGRYRLRAVADPGGWFKERIETNNFTWVDIRISSSSVSVIRYGPAAKPISLGGLLREP